jgi:hypothetical protein
VNEALFMRDELVLIKKVSHCIFYIISVECCAYDVFLIKVLLDSF